MKKVLLGLVVVVMMTNNAKAEFYIAGLGTISCGTVIANENLEPWKGGIQSWVQGFITGINSQNQSMKNGDVEGMYYDVVRRCKDQPLEYMYNIAYQMYLDLPDNR